MLGSLVVGLGAVAVLLSVGSLAVFVRYRRRTRDRRALETALKARLADAMGPGTGSHLERAPTVRRIAVIDTHGDAGEDRPVYAPVVRIDLETTDAPGMKLILEYVAEVLEAIHPEVADRDATVSHYDVEFTFGPGGLLVDGECQRVSVAPELAERLCRDDGFDAFDLWQAVRRADGDDETPTTLWGPCRSTSRLPGSRQSTADASSPD